MPAHRVVKQLDAIEHIRPGFVPCFVNVLLDSLGLEQREEALCHRIVMAIHSTAHAGFQIVIVKELAPITAAESAVYIQTTTIPCFSRT